MSQQTEGDFGHFTLCFTVLRPACLLVKVDQAKGLVGLATVKLHIFPCIQGQSLLPCSLSRRLRHVELNRAPQFSFLSFMTKAT